VASPAVAFVADADDADDVDDVDGVDDVDVVDGVDVMNGVDVVDGAGAGHAAVRPMATTAMRVREGM
jgi:hypothetical protein